MLLIYNTVFKNKVFSDEEIENKAKENDDKILKEASNIDGLASYKENNVGVKSLSDLLEMNEFIFETDNE